MAGLEFRFLGLLRDEKHGIRNLERQAEAEPAFFVHMVSVRSRPADGADDPAALGFASEDQRKAASDKAFAFFKQLRRIPGTRVDGSIDADRLAAWVDVVREGCASIGRAFPGDYQIGELLARSPPDAGGTWPCRAVAAVMERLQAPDIGRGFELGVYNSRGAHERGKGGEQERELAEKYRDYAAMHRISAPYVAALLYRIADRYAGEGIWQDDREMREQRLFY
jgi:hypothetical protein